MAQLSSSFFIAVIILALTVGILLFLLISKIKRIKQLTASLIKLRSSFNRLDEQAKLIIKTDLELNRAQEELDKRLSSLDALQKTSRLISTSLDEREIFHRLDSSLLNNLGYEKNLILIYDEGTALNSRLALGYSAKDLEFIIPKFQSDNHLIKTLSEGHTFSSVNAPKVQKENISQTFSTEHFVISPILTQNGIIGFVFVGNGLNAPAVTEGDEEFISILANQVGQALENARLFEEVYRSSQVLESKVQDRTKQLASALEEVQIISKTKSEFISAVSHELRTPLTSIKGYASLLMTGKLGDIPDQVKARLEKINIHSDNLVKLINDLLDISRIESGRVEMKMGECHINLMVDNVHDLLTPQMKEKDIQWVSEIDAHIPVMYLDRSQVERVFINLVGNAIKFTPEKGTIRVKATLDKNVVTIEVSDTGIGIPAEDINRLFDEFYRVENQINQNVKGTGLGLALAKKIVEAHSGTIWVTSKVNEGTTFHFTLPATLERTGSGEA